MKTSISAARRQAWIVVVFAALVLALSLHVLTGNVLPPWLAIHSAPVGLLLVVLGAVLLANAAPQSLLLRALDATSCGRGDEAEALLASMPGYARRWLLPRQLHLVRGWLAFRAGASREAAQHATDALRVRRSGRASSGGDPLTTGAHALRALARASDGDEGARADIEAVRGDGYAATSLLAEASLAEGMLLAHHGQTEKLATLLRADRRLLFDGTGPAERARVRQLRRRLEEGSEGAYRRPARQELLLQEASPATPPSSARAPEPAVTAEAVARLDASMRLATKQTNVAPAAAVMVMAVTAVLAWATVEFHGSRASRNSSAASWLDLMWIVVSMLAWIMAIGGLDHAARARRAARRLAEVVRLDAAEGGRAAWAPCEQLARERGQHGASAEAQLAVFAQRAAAFDEALAACDRGLSKLGKILGPLRPTLLAHKAYALAALGRRDEARTHLALLQGGFPDFSALSATRMRVELMLAVRDEDLEVARAVVRDRPRELLSDYRDEILADALLALHERSRDELARIDREMLDAPELRDWLRAVSPTVADQVHALAAA